MAFRFTLAAAAAALLASTAASAAVQNFASFSSTATGTNFRWVRSANSGTGANTRTVNFYTTATSGANAAGNTRTLFTFQNLGGFSATYSAVPARFFMSGTVTNTAATLNGNTIIQTNVTGSFSFTAMNSNHTAVTPITYGNVTGSNLLSGTFSMVTFSGDRNSSSGAINGSTTGGSTISYTSDFLTFSPGSNYGMSLSLNSIAPVLAFTSNRAVPTFRAVIGGQFSSDPPPVPPSIPEPGTWAMMIAGIGMVGFARRRRRTAVAA